MHHFRKTIGSLLLGAALAGGLVTVAIAPPSAQAQAGLGTLAGTVTDSSHALVPGATVTLTNTGTGFSQTTTTNSGGIYHFTALEVTSGYSLKVSASGFKTEELTGLTTSVGTTITADVTLEIGSNAQTVEVSAAVNVEQVQTDTSAVSQLIDATVFNESPLSVRSSNTFVGLTAGAAPDSANTDRGYSINGARTGTGNFLLEGFDNNDQGLGGGGAAGGVGGAVTTVSPDAIQEYRVISSVPNAEYGRAGGFATDTVLKSGTKQWHGSLFEYNRIQALAQNSWFSKNSGLQDHLVRNQFGGSVGGPIYKDRTFFYATVEFQRQSQGSPVTYVATTQDFYNFIKSGQFEQWAEASPAGYCVVNTDSACPGAFANAATLGPVFQAEYAQTGAQTFPFGTRNLSYTASDLFGGTYPVAIYGDGSFIGTESLSQNRGTLKIDHRLTNKDQLAFTYSADLNGDDFNYGASNNTPGLPEIYSGGAQIFGARWTHAFSTNLLNEFRAGYTRHVSNFAAAGPQTTAATFTADSLYTGFGKANSFPQLFTENEFLYEDALTWTKGAHNTKYGFRFMRTRNGSSFYNDVNGTLAFWGAPGLMTDAVSDIDVERVLDGGTTGDIHSAYGSLYYASASEDPSTDAAPDPYRGYRANEFAAYAQDEWKVSPKLFVNYGVRWEYFGPPHNFRGGVDSNVYFGDATSVSSTNPFAPTSSLYLGEQSAQFECVGSVACGTPGTGAGYAPASGTSTIWDRDLNNFAPRVGFSYDVFGTGKLVLRGGFGVGYDRLYNNVYENIRFNAPHFVDNTAGYGYGDVGISEALTPELVQNPFVGNADLPTGAAVPRHVNQHLKTAYYENIHFGFETNILNGYVIEANYIGTLGRQLVGIMNANTFEGRVACSSSAQQDACAAAGLTTAQMSTARPNSTFGNDNFRTNGFSSNYNGAQVSLRRSYVHGFQVLANYSYGHAFDETSDVFTIKGAATGIPTPYYPSHSYGNADFDVRHLASFTVNYRTESQKHKLLLAGWGISPILTMRSGSPIYMKDGNSAYDPNEDGTTGVEEIIYSGHGNPHSSLRTNVSPYTTGAISAANWPAYTCPATVNSGLWCDVPTDRNQMYGFRQYDLDAAISKHFLFRERFGLTLQASFFNVDGHVQWNDPSGDINSSDFGRSTNTSNTREGQLSARIEF